MEYLLTLAAAFAQVTPFSPKGLELFPLILLGSLVGTVVGILPGLGGITAMVLALPFLYSVEPYSALIFLVALSSVVATAGDVTSVLFGIPGEATAAATVVDGHRMTHNGEGGRGVFAAVSSSMIGAVIGSLLLALAIPLVRPLVLTIASGEQFMLVLFAITYISVLSKGNFAAGMLAGGVGLLLSMVGMDPTTAVPRFTLEPLIGMQNALNLLDGVSIVAVSLGLFSVPALVDMMCQGTLRSRIPAIGEFLRTGLRDVRRHFGLIIKSSLIGSYIGLLPGVGGSVAQWVAYSSASGGKYSERAFGDGAIEGVIAPGAANNSKEGGALIPTLAFGIPGSLSMTILLAAFVLFGIQPGQSLLDPNDGLPFTYSLVWTIVLANMIVVLITLIALPLMVRIAQVPQQLLAPFLILFMLVGAYAFRQSVFDIWVVLIFGLIGLGMRRVNWPRAPLLLGLVLGGLAENSLHLAMNAYGLEWLSRPGVIIIALLTGAALLWRFKSPRQ